MIVLVARYQGKSGQGDTIEAALRRMASLVAENEPGCKLYQASRSRENPDLFLLYEHYTDESALISHRETPYFQQIIEGTIVPLIEKRERELYTLAIG